MYGSSMLANDYALAPFRGWVADAEQRVLGAGRHIGVRGGRRFRERECNWSE